MKINGEYDHLLMEKNAELYRSLIKLSAEIKYNCLKTKRYKHGTKITQPRLVWQKR